jgi:hypothetical protein
MESNYTLAAEISPRAVGSLSLTKIGIEPIRSSRGAEGSALQPTEFRLCSRKNFLDALYYHR